jgi:mannosyltransferase OCH1-like enzyme
VGVIPRILHRTLPAQPDPDCERIWGTVVANTDGWDRRTYQSPRDPADWPLTGHLFHLCRDKAEESDLVRLEALWVHGGVYLDSDMELTQPLDWIRDKGCFTGWESPVWFGMAMIGAPPEHPAIGLLMDVFTKHVAAQVERSTLPIIATNTWRDRDDVTVLAQKAFYPYHNGIDPQNAGKDWASDPEVFAIHRWHGSWLK